jgi:hypothetical protein
MILAGVAVDPGWPLCAGGDPPPDAHGGDRRVSYRASFLADPYQAVHLCQRLRARAVRVNAFTFSSSSVGRLALTLYRLLRDQALDLDGDDQALLDELASVRLVESAPGVYRIDHDASEHDDRVISLALAAQALVERPSGQATVRSAGAMRLPGGPVGRGPTGAKPSGPLPDFVRRMNRRMGVVAQPGHYKAPGER